jgi:hypothetical protein
MAKRKTTGTRVKQSSRRVVRTTKPAQAPATDLSDAEKDLISHMEAGWQLETDSLGGDVVLRNSKSDEVVRPASANRSTIKALDDRGLIAPAKGHDPLRITWRLTEK